MFPSNTNNQNDYNTQIYNRRRLTSLTVVLGPAALAEVPVDGGGLAGGLSDGHPGAHVSALSAVLVSHDVVVLHGVEDLGPVQSGEIAEIRVLLNPHGPSGDVHQAVEADLSQMEHLEHHQGVVEEQFVASDDGEVGEEIAEGLHAGNSEEQQVVGDHREFGETEAPEILGLGAEHE